jgi:hypothetical protein
MTVLKRTASTVPDKRIPVVGVAGMGDEALGADALVEDLGSREHALAPTDALAPTAARAPSRSTRTAVALKRQ